LQKTRTGKNQKKEETERRALTIKLGLDHASISKNPTAAGGKTGAELGKIESASATQKGRNENSSTLRKSGSEGGLWWLLLPTRREEPQILKVER